MEFYLQFGYGMMELSRSLVRDWGGGTVILSPRDLREEQLSKLANQVRRRGGEVLLDPQFYLPRAEHERLRSHRYWPDDYDSTGFWSGPDLTQLLTQLLSLNHELNSASFVLPGLYTPEVDDDWLSRQSMMIEEAERLGLSASDLIVTVALGSSATRDEDQIHEVLNAADDWDAEGVYLVCEHSNVEYLVTDPNWLANVIDLAAGLRLKGKQVIIGYCNQQMLIAACASASAVASGTWMNVRSFPPTKFRAFEEQEERRRATWYYCPQCLSEFTIPFLDVAWRQGVLQQLVPPASPAGNLSAVLFQGDRPTSVGFREPQAFHHYLATFRDQVVNSRLDTFDDTVAAHEQMLDEAESLLTDLHAVGVRGQHRDFLDIVDVNRAAIALLQSTRGPTLRRYWNEL